MSEFHLSEELLNEYVDHALPSVTVDKIEAHLAECDLCSAQLEGLVGLFAELESIPDIPLKRDLSAGVMSSIRPAVTVPRRWQWIVVGQFVLTGLVLMFTIPAVLASEGYQEFVQRLNEFGVRIGIHSSWNIAAQFQIFFNDFAQQLVFRLRNFQIPNLPFTLISVLPILLVTGFLWLVGNGLLLRKQIR